MSLRLRFNGCFQGNLQIEIDTQYTDTDPNNKPQQGSMQDPRSVPNRRHLIALALREQASRSCEANRLRAVCPGIGSDQTGRDSCSVRRLSICKPPG